MSGTAAVNTNLINVLQTDLQTYKNAITNTQSLVAQKNDLTAEVRDLTLQMKELDRVEQTYEKEYLDRKHSPAEKKAWGLNSAQDFALAAFYFSYFFFAAVFTLYATINSAAKLYTLLTLVVTFFMIGLLMTFAIINYG